MSTQITTAFVQQFSNTITLLAQQRGSKLRGAVREESVTGEKAFFDQIGSVAAIKKVSRHARMLAH
jgi:predicted DNA-binding ribbon-helix-helix protein